VEPAALSRFVVVYQSDAGNYFGSENHNVHVGSELDIEGNRYGTATAPSNLADAMHSILVCHQLGEFAVSVAHSDLLSGLGLITIFRQQLDIEFDPKLAERCVHVDGSMIRHLMQNAIDAGFWCSHA
jgi:hypothetical protein